MNSMTGYGRGAKFAAGRQLTIELKSVNHRFLDISFRMPRSFAFLEEDMRAQMASRLTRGHVDVFVTYRNLRSDSKVVQVDPALMGAYCSALDEIKTQTGMPDDRSLMNFARLPDLLIVTEADEDQEALRMLERETMGMALDALCSMRLREGLSMAADLSRRVSNLEAMTVKIKARYPDTILEYEERLRARIEELIAGAVDPQRLLQEVAVMADRSAISEELVRLESHIAQMREMFLSQEPHGRKMDFLVQELNREVNTISSKSQDIKITQLVVSAKAEIEKLREQVQNVE